MFYPWVRELPWRRELQPTLVFLAGESHGQKSLVGLQSIGSQRVRHDWNNWNDMHDKYILTMICKVFNNSLWRVDSLEKIPMLGGIGGRRKRGQQRMRWLDGITNSMDVSEWTPGVGDGQGGLEYCNSWGSQSRIQLSDWTELKSNFTYGVKYTIMHKCFMPTIYKTICIFNE